MGNLSTCSWSERSTGGLNLRLQAEVEASHEAELLMCGVCASELSIIGGHPVGFHRELENCLV